MKGFFSHFERDLAMLKLPIAIFVMDCIPLSSYDYEGKIGNKNCY